MTASRFGSTFDYLVIGAGIFGSYAALRMADAGLKVMLIDHERRPWRKASMVNQARLHFGYHYPRSIATARLANGYRERFQKEHEAFINATFAKYYAIDRSGSLTSASQFERFCDFVNIRCRRTSRPELFRGDRLEGLFETTEHSFDPMLLRDHYQQRLEASDVVCGFGWVIEAAHADGATWAVTVTDPAGERRTLQVASVLNATYANINAVNEVFGLEDVGIDYEMSEVAILSSPQLRDIGLTVMDGPFFSVMPYGRSGFHSLTSVLYTHHGVNRSAHPTFGCQSRVPGCTPRSLATCTSCVARPRSNINKMLSQMSQYLAPDVEAFVHGSLFTIKAKLKSSQIDDARPTDIRIISESPKFAYVFSGKINSIYEVEQLIDDA